MKVYEIQNKTGDIYIKITPEANEVLPDFLDVHKSKKLGVGQWIGLKKKLKKFNKIDDSEEILSCETIKLK